MATSIATPICLGSVAAIALNNRKTYENLEVFVGGYCKPVIWGSLVLALALNRALPTVLSHVAMTCLLMSVVVQARHALSWFSNNAVVRYVGEISYGMYVFHMVAINAVRLVVFQQADPQALHVLLAGLALTIAVAAASFHFYEKPFLSLKRKFRGNRG